MRFRTAGRHALALNFEGVECLQRRCLNLQKVPKMRFRGDMGQILWPDPAAHVCFVGYFSRFEILPGSCRQSNTAHTRIARRSTV